MCKIWGFARVSTKHQRIDRQIKNIKAVYPDAVIIQEVYTGTRMEGRVEFEKLCKTVKTGDKIVFDSVSRMSRNAEEGFQLYQDFFNQGIELEFIKEPHINTAVYREALDKQVQSITTGDSATDELMEAIIGGINRYMMRLAEQQIKIAFNQAEKEVQDLHQRVKEGMAVARLNNPETSTPGVKKGTKLVVKKAQPTKDKIKKYSKDFDGSLDDVEVMKLVGVARNTYYKYKKEMREEG